MKRPAKAAHGTAVRDDEMKRREEDCRYAEHNTGGGAEIGNTRKGRKNVAHVLRAYRRKKRVHCFPPWSQARGKAARGRGKRILLASCSSKAFGMALIGARHCDGGGREKS